MLALLAVTSLALAGAMLERPDFEVGGHASEVLEDDGAGEEGLYGSAPVLFEYVVVGALLLIFVGGAFYFLHDHRDAMRMVAGTVVGIGILVGVWVVVYWLFGATMAESMAVNEPPTPPQEGEGTAGEDRMPGGPLGLLLLYVGAMVVAVAVLLLTRRKADDGEEPTEADPAGGTVDVESDIRSAAGRAADRLETSADVDNEIYRAWREMTDLVPATDPSSTTPREFAARLVDAGLDRGEVEALTSLFEAVRYGHEEATADREQRALEALRRLEAAPDAGGTREVSTPGASDARSADSGSRGDGR